MRPVTINDGLASRDRLSPASLVASLARLFKSSMASCGLFRVGRIDLDFSHSLPISLISPGFSSCAGDSDDGTGSCRAADRSGADGWAGVGCAGICGPGAGGAACGQPAPAASTSIESAIARLAACALDCAL